MNDKHDPVDRALRSLRSAQWTGESHNAKLEEKLMQEFHTNHTSSFVSRHRTLAAALAIVLVGGAGFAAAGGTEAVKQLFVTLQIIGPNGETQVVDAILEPTDDGGGSATMNLNAGDGKEATILLEKVPDEDAETETTAITVQLDGGAKVGCNELSITTGSDEEANAIMMQAMQATIANQGDGQTKSARFGRAIHPIVQDRIGDAVFSDNYEDQDGLWQELSVVAEDAGDIQSFSVYTTFISDAGETQYRRIGSMVGVDPATTDVASVEWDESGLATIHFVGEEGTEISLKVDPYDRANGTATMTFVKEDGSIGVVDLKSDRGTQGAIKTIQIHRDNRSDR